ncbi:MAG: DUF4389 domain-containing protein [Solirubrobacteraceae bacterium]|nr:DUF4389 domain-containing protein [Solirubrobacteraceae bacterium]
MSNYPVTYAQVPPVERNRLTVFFRLLILIPHALWLLLYGIAVYVAVVIAWFAIVFTGRWPLGLYDFTAGFLRLSGRVFAYGSLITDTYPPFDGGEHPEYPVRIAIAPPKATYSRAKTFFRLILAIPIYFVQYVLTLWLLLVAIAVWFCGVFAGRTSPGLMETMRMPAAFYLRANAYFFLLTEDWPPFDPGAPAAAPAAAPAPPAPPAAPAMPSS